MLHIDVKCVYKFRFMQYLQDGPKKMFRCIRGETIFNVAFNTPVLLQIQFDMSIYAGITNTNSVVSGPSCMLA